MSHGIVTEAMRLQIEYAIARHWPDFQRVQRTAGASVEQVAEVVAQMEAAEEVQDDPRWTPERLRKARASCARLRKAGVKLAEMPTWVREGARAYDAEHRRSSYRRARHEQATA